MQTIAPIKTKQNYLQKASVS